MKVLSVYISCTRLLSMGSRADLCPVHLTQKVTVSSCLVTQWDRRDLRC